MASPTSSVLGAAAGRAWGLQPPPPEATAPRHGADGEDDGAGRGGAGAGAEPGSEMLAAEPASPKEVEWRSTLGGWRERAERRAEEAQRRELEFKMLLQRRDEEEVRKALEEKRKREAAAREAQRRREAAEYTTWRQDAVLARKAEERARAQEHQVWREGVAKNARGLALPVATLKQVRGLTAAAAARATAAEAKVEAFEAAACVQDCGGCDGGGSPTGSPGGGAAAARCTATRSAPAGGGRCAATRSAPASARGVVAEAVLSPMASLHVPRGGAAMSPKASSQAQALVPFRPSFAETGPISPREQRNLDEEEAWRAAVAKNREALVAERAARIRKEAQQQRDGAAAPSVAAAAAAVGRPEWGVLAAGGARDMAATATASPRPAAARPLTGGVRFGERTCVEY